MRLAARLYRTAERRENEEVAFLPQSWHYSALPVADPPSSPGSTSPSPVRLLRRRRPSRPRARAERTSSSPPLPTADEGVVRGGDRGASPPGTARPGGDGAREEGRAGEGGRPGESLPGAGRVRVGTGITPVLPGAAPTPASSSRRPVAWGLGSSRLWW
mmetsp:Transcript_34511/g.77537  ORF Transcript_34511/g.77537 Transcript_34511/m.77537 type:complete len:159 (+) Transcript_34511:1504-1980(+)